MDRGAVVALVVVLGDHLPVRRDLVGVPVGEHQRARRRTAPGSRRGHRGARRRPAPPGCPAGAARARTPSPARPSTGSSTSPWSAVSNPSTSRNPGAPFSAPAEVVGPRVVRAGDRAAARRSRPPAAARGRGAGRCSRTSAAPSRVAHDAGSRCRRSRARAGWSRSSGNRSSTRPRQVHLPANRCRRSQASTSSDVYASAGHHPHRLLVRRSTSVMASSAPMLATLTRRARRSVDVRRDEILTATVDLVDRLGLAAVRVGDVAAELGVSAVAGLLPLRHQGRPGRRGLRARRRARPRPHRQGARPGDDPVERLRRLLQLYGPTGQAVGLAGVDRRLGAGPARDPHPQGAAAGSTTAGRSRCGRWSRTASPSGAFTCADPAGDRAPRGRAARRPDRRDAGLQDGHPRPAARVGGRPRRARARGRRRRASLRSSLTPASSRRSRGWSAPRGRAGTATGRSPTTRS